MVTSHGGSWVSGLLPAGGEGRLHDYSPLGARVGFLVTSCWEVDLIVTSCWGSWFQGYSPLGERVGFYDHFSLGMLGFMVTSGKKEKRRNISKRRRKEQRKARLNLYNYVLFTSFRVSPRCGRGWVVWILPTGGEGGFYGYFPWRCSFLVTS